MHCPGENATEPIWRVLASSDEISLKTSTKYSLFDCLSGGNPVYVDYASAVKKGIIKILWVDLLCLAFLGLGEPACFHWEICPLISGSEQ